VNHNPRREKYDGVNHYTKGKGVKKMNIIRKVFRYLFQPIEVEVRFPLIVWAIFAIEILVAVIISIIGKVEIVCK
jgi:hypothetical protein